MRGSDQRSGALSSYVDLESRVRRDHPLRPIRGIVNEVLASLSAEFEAIYATGVGRPSIPPERLLRALLLQASYGIRSERQVSGRDANHSLNISWDRPKRPQGPLNVERRPHPRVRGRNLLG